MRGRGSVADAAGRLLAQLNGAAPPSPATGDTDGNPRDTGAPAGPALRYWTLEEAQADAELMAPPVPVVAPLAYAGRVTVLSAREKMGKSTLCGDVVAALSHGRAFFAGDAPAACPVLWYGVDEPLGDAVRRLAAAGAHPGRVVLCGDRPTPAEVAAAVAATGARLVVLDTLSELWRGRVDKDGDAGQVAAFLRPFVDVARATGAALLFLYHTNKGGQEYRGSVALGATVDAVLTLKPARAATLGAGTPAGGAGGGTPGPTDDDGDDDAGAVDDDGRRVLLGRTRWGVVRVRLGFDGTRYALGDAPLPLALRALRCIRAGAVTAASELGRVLGVAKARGLALARELEDAGQVRRARGVLELTPFGEAAAAGGDSARDGSGDGSGAPTLATPGTEAGTEAVPGDGTAEPPGTAAGTEPEPTAGASGTGAAPKVPARAGQGTRRGNRGPAVLGEYGDAA